MKHWPFALALLTFLTAFAAMAEPVEEARLADEVISSITTDSIKGSCQRKFEIYQDSA